MTSSEYRNTIMWTLSTQTHDSQGCLAIIRLILNNLGVALPQGDVETVLSILGSGDYMSWTECSAEQARFCANNGYTAIGIKNNNIVVILPDRDKIIIETIVPITPHPVVRSLSDIAEVEMINMRFFSYAALTNPEPVQIECS